MSDNPRHLLRMSAERATGFRTANSHHTGGKASSGPDAPRIRPGSVIVLALGSGVVSALVAANVAGFAALTGSTTWAVTAGLGAAALASWIMAILLRIRQHRQSRLGSRLRHPGLGPAVIFGCAALLSLSWLYPGSGHLEPEPVAGIEWLTRPDGSRLALHVSRAAEATRPPIIVVHGGPGVADMAHDVPAFARLARDRDVWVYDRVGTGASTRLTDPMSYTTTRAVADLEAVRQQTAADRVVLLGHSWGARFAVSYLQQHPNQVAALILSAPGDLPVEGERVPPGDLTTQLDSAQKARLYLRLARPRNLFTYAMTAADPRVAHRIAGDEEMDRRFAAIYADSAAALFCNDRLADRVGTTGVGYYAHYVPQLHPDPADLPVDVKTLTTVKLPVLIIKPGCDYLPWSTAGYRRAFPAARLVMLPDAGHAAYLEQPMAYTRLVTAFLGGRRLPLPTITGAEIPDGYRGTR